MPAQMFSHQVRCFWLSSWCLMFLMEICSNLLSGANIMFLIKFWYELHKYWQISFGNGVISNYKKRDFTQFVRKVGWKNGDLLKKEKEGLRPSLILVHRYCCWEFSEETRTYGFDIFQCFFSKNLMFFKDPSLASLSSYWMSIAAQ